MPSAVWLVIGGNEHVWELIVGALFTVSEEQ